MSFLSLHIWSTCNIKAEEKKASNPWRLIEIQCVDVTFAYFVWLPPWYWISESNPKLMGSAQSPKRARCQLRFLVCTTDKRFPISRWVKCEPAGSVLIHSRWATFSVLSGHVPCFHSVTVCIQSCIHENVSPSSVQFAWWCISGKVHANPM